MESEHTNMSGVLDMWKAKNQNKSSDWKKNIWKSSSGGKNIKNLWSPSGGYLGMGLFGSSGKYLGKASILGGGGVFGSPALQQMMAKQKSKTKWSDGVMSKIAEMVARAKSGGQGGGGIGGVSQAVASAIAKNEGGAIGQPPEETLANARAIANKQLTNEEIKDKLRTDIMNDLALSGSQTPEEQPMSMGKKIGFGMAGVVLLFGMGYLLFKGGKKNKGSRLKGRRPAIKRR